MSKNEDGTCITIPSLPSNTAIEEWRRLKYFIRSFIRTKHLDLSESNINEIKTIIRNAKVPTILSLRTKHYNELKEKKHYFEAPRLQILFGTYDDEKLLALEHCGNHYYFHGLWYLIMTDFYCIPTILNNADDIIFVGIGFKYVPNEDYSHRWGYNHNPECTRFDQGAITIAGGGFICRRLTQCNADHLGEKPNITTE